MVRKSKSDAKERPLQELVQLTNQLVAEYGDPERSAEFDAAQWLSAWLERPQPSLAMRRPIDLLGSIEGRTAVETLLIRIAVDAFA